MRGVIAAGDPQTVAAGVEMFHKGGNAVDAAVAAAFAALVSEAVLVNIGGGGLAVLWDGHEGVVYDFLPTMPGRPPFPRMDFTQVWVDFGEEQQPFYIGRASVAVPGLVAGLCALAEEWGMLPLATLLSPAIRLAREGAVLSEPLAYILRILMPIFSYTPEMAAVFTRDGRPYGPGERLRFPELAHTLERLAQEGPALFYEGEIAQAIVADQESHGGLITREDLAAYRVLKHSPLHVPYRQRSVLVPPPPSNGGALVGFSLRLLDGLPVNTWEHNGVEYIHALATVMALTNEARSTWDRLRVQGTSGADTFLQEEHVAPYRKRLATALSSGRWPTTTTSPGSPYTTHISVADENGLWVSLTTTAGENAGFLVGETGVSLNNMLGELDLHPQGFHRLKPGERLSSMMTPTIVLEDGHPRVATGSGGSSRIRSAVLQVLLNVLDYDFPVQEAVELPRVHYEADVLQLEGGIEPHVAQALAARGYRINRWSTRNMYFGGAHTIVRQHGRLDAAGDPRRGGATYVYVS